MEWTDKWHLEQLNFRKSMRYPLELFFNKCRGTLFNNTMWFYRGVGHAILGHFKKRISKLNVIVRLLTKLRGAVLFLHLFGFVSSMI